MIEFTATIKQFGAKGEKTKWTYIDIPSTLAQQLKPGTKKAFRVKGYLDAVAIEGLSLTPMGGGDYIAALKSSLRKALHKEKGATLKVKLETDESEIVLSEDLLKCLADDPQAFDNFRKLPKSHQKYYSNWVQTAKTDMTKAKRIAAAVTSLSHSVSFGQMLRNMKAGKDEWKLL